MAEHVIDPRRVHHEWDASLEPTLSIASGDTVVFELAMAGSGQVALGARYGETTFDLERMYNLLGPVWLDGAAPGDSIEIEVVGLESGAWGWTMVLPGFGLLADDFAEPYLRTFPLTSGRRIEVAPGIGVPIVPFLGTMGTHPGGAERQPAFPPHRGGGNMDNRHLVVGSSVFLPVWCPGALFSCGDPHAAQGDGEVCVSAVECDMRAALRFHLHKRRLNAPRYTVPASVAARDDGGYVGTMGIDSDLMEGARAAVRGMIEWLSTEHGLSREDAYILCSLAGDLKIHEIVDSGVWNVGLTIARSVFGP